MNGETVELYRIPGCHTTYCDFDTLHSAISSFSKEDEVTSCKAEGIFEDKKAKKNEVSTPNGGITKSSLFIYICIFAGTLFVEIFVILYIIFLRNPYKNVAENDV